MRQTAAYLIVFFFSSLFLLPAGAENIPGQMIVRVKPGTISLPKGVHATSIKGATIKASSVQALTAKYAATRIKQLYRDALGIRPDWRQLADQYLLYFSSQEAVEGVVSAFSADPNVLSARPNLLVKAYEITPTDPSYSKQWGLVKTEFPRGWEQSTGTTDAQVAVLDTGIDYNHEEFSGRVNLAKAKNYIDDNDDPLDDNGHGTEVSGVIAATANNGKGIAGIDWHGKILPIKVLNYRGEGSIADVSQGLAYVTALRSIGTNIAAINMSLGQSDPDSELDSRCQEAYLGGLVLIAAAGNENVSTKTYPAASSGVVAIASTDQNDQRSIWSAGQASNYGDWVDLSAPGTTIYTTNRSNSYTYSNGTSLAAPLVTGLVMLLRAANPAMSSANAVDRLLSSADNIDSLNPGYEGKLGRGRANAYKTLSGLTATITSPSSSESSRYIRGTVPVTGTSRGWNFQGYYLEAVSGGAVITIEAGTVSVESGTLGSWNTAGLNGEYTLRLRTIAADSSSVEADVAVVADNLTPEVIITLPASGESVDGQVEIRGSANEAYLNYYRLDYAKATTPSVFQNIGSYYQPVSAGRLGTWETAGLSGAYLLKLLAVDKAGNSAETTTLLNLTGLLPPTREVEAMGSLPPTFILPNPFDRSATAEAAFVYQLAGNFNTRIYLFDLNGNLVWQKSYLAGDNGGKSGLNNPGWNATNLFSEAVVNGVYIYQIVAENKIIGRGKVIVLN